MKNKKKIKRVPKYELAHIPFREKSRMEISKEAWSKTVPPHFYLRAEKDGKFMRIAKIKLPNEIPSDFHNLEVMDGDVNNDMKKDIVEWFGKPYGVRGTSSNFTVLWLLWDAVEEEPVSYISTEEEK